MNVSMGTNQYLVTEVKVALNSDDDPDLIRLDMTEREVIHSHTFGLAMDRAQWQQVADQLAALGVASQAVTA